MGKMARVGEWFAGLSAVLVLLGTGAYGVERMVSVGVAKVDVTPLHPVVLAGYGGRQTEFEGVETRLWARAMVIGDVDPVAVVVIDNCGVPGVLRDILARRVAAMGISSERLVVSATHTHNAPNLAGYAPVLWAGRMTPGQEERMRRYTDFAIEKMAQALGQALENREPLALSWAQGRVDFGGNRRVLGDGRWQGFGLEKGGPVDHSLPVLVARDEEGKVKALWANYACHCTTLGARNHVHGDWAGYANEAMERNFPLARALMTIGCGADIGPQPSGGAAVAKRHGQAIGDEVQRLVEGGLRKLNGAPTVASVTASLPLVEPKPREFWEGLRSKGGFEGELGVAMLKRLDEGERIPNQVAYPVTSWRFDNDLAMVFLPGEVVVDYSVRLNRELAWPRLWLTAWSNGMPGYIPSKRILKEGGYEADFSQVYYGQPGRYRDEVEDEVVGAVRKVVGESFLAPADQERAPFHRLPSQERRAIRRLSERAKEHGPPGSSVLRKAFYTHLRHALPALQAVIPLTAEETAWHNWAGDFVPRFFIRQEKRAQKVGWLGRVPARGDTPRVLCFSGGLGWSSEPTTGGFSLVVGGQERLRFDLARELSFWQGVDGALDLYYLPAWKSEVDTGGVFLIVLGEQFLAKGGQIEFRVESVGEGSKRWFAIDAEQEMERVTPMLLDALNSWGK